MGRDGRGGRARVGRGREERIGEGSVVEKILKIGPGSLVDNSSTVYQLILLYFAEVLNVYDDINVPSYISARLIMRRLL